MVGDFGLHSLFFNKKTTLPTTNNSSKVRKVIFNRMPITLVAAISKNNCIGKDGALPWHMPEDLKHFKKLTTDKIVLMGRKTWESLPEKFRPLPNRLNIVITRQIEYDVPAGVEVYFDVEQAFASHREEDIFVIGGGQMYNLTINLAESLEITHVEKEVEGDVFFPTIDLSIWEEVNREDHERFSFVKYTKK